MRGLERVYTQKSQLARPRRRPRAAARRRHQRARAHRRADEARDHPGGAVPQAGLAAARLEQVLEIDPTHEAALVALERCYRAPPPVARSHQHLRAAHLRRRSSARRRSSSTARWRRSTPTRSRTSTARSTRTATSSTSTTRNIPALEALSKLYEKQGDAAQAIDYMTRVADLTAGRQAARRDVLPHRQGARREARRSRSRRKSATRWRSISIRRTCRRSRRCGRSRSTAPTGTAPRATSIRSRCNTQAPRQRAKLLVELGTSPRRDARRARRAVQAYELALAVRRRQRGRRAPARRPSTSTSEKWAKAEPLADLLVRKAGKRERREQHTLLQHARHGRERARQGRQGAQGLPGRAQARSHRPGDDPRPRRRVLPAEGLGRRAHQLPEGAHQPRRGRDRGARQRLLQARLHQAGAGPGEAGDQQLREGARASTPRTAPRSKRSSASTPSLKDWKQVCAYKRQILDNVFDGDERFKLLVEIGDIWSDKDKNPHKAHRDARGGARSRAEEPRAARTSCCSSTRRRSNWPKMIETLQAHRRPRDEPRAQGQVHLHDGAALPRQGRGPGSRGRALQRDARSQPDLPRGLRAHQQDPHGAEGLEAARARLPQDAPPRRRQGATPTSSTTSGTTSASSTATASNDIIARHRGLQDGVAPQARRARSSARSSPSSTRRPTRSISAIDEQQADPRSATRCASIRTARSTGSTSKQQRLRSGVVHVPGARVPAQGRRGGAAASSRTTARKGMLQVKSRLDNELWMKNLFHQDENLYIGKIFEMLAAAALMREDRSSSRTTKQLPVLDKRFKQDPATSTVTFAKTFGWAAQVLGVPCPELYVRNDVPGALVGGAHRAAGFGRRSERAHRLHAAGAHVHRRQAPRYYRGEHYIKNLFPTVPELTMLLFAGMKMVAAGVRRCPARWRSAGQRDGERAREVHAADPHRGRSASSSASSSRTAPRRTSSAGCQCVELTACRAGLLLCGTSRSPRRSSPPSRSSPAIFRRRTS